MGSRTGIKVAPPERINVQKFAESRGSELESLHAVVKNRLDNDFRSQRSKRRRTTSYDSQVAKKRRRNHRNAALLIKADSNEKDSNNASIPRQVRRRTQLKMNPKEGFSTSGDGTKRLRTHVWHAKRFTMTKLWGYYLPLGLHGRGKGSRSLLKNYRNGVLLHDASYYVAIQLEGPEDSLLSILRMVLVPTRSDCSDDIASSVLSGAVYDNAMLHHVGAPFSKAIAPVTYMWRPCRVLVIDNNGAVDKHEGYVEPEDTKCSSLSRQLWVWIHASAVSEGYGSLKLACQKQMEMGGILINCFSLEGQLAKFEVIGPKAFQLLQKTLHPVTWTPENSWQLREHLHGTTDDYSQFENRSILQNEEHIISNAILSLTVVDPRLPLEKTNNADDKDSASIVMPGSGEQSTLHGGDLWHASSIVSPPVDESVLSKEKNDLRQNYFYLDNPNSIAQNALEVNYTRCCPIMLLKNKVQNGLNMGWSVMLPISWIRAFWGPLISKGAHVIGLREKHWVASEVGLPYFPSDYPDCNAYSCLKATEAASAYLKEEARPPALRPLRIPIPAPWDSIQVSLHNRLPGVGDCHVFREENRENGSLLSNSDSTYSDNTSPNCQGNLLDCFVARTSSMLTNFLTKIQGNHLLLFPQVGDENTSFQKVLKNEKAIGQEHSCFTNIIYKNRLCFLRVLIHAFKEGSFEEGAVICAPQITDISLWTSRSENTEGSLQMPQSALASYFKEQSSGKWELQMPEDITDSGSHRWPIGFVTTGFVRGCKKPVAEAFCEAVLLAHLRKEQWKDLPVKRRRKEIYVLVRNLRSTAYRLALATVVLEQQEEDVESL